MSLGTLLTIFVVPTVYTPCWRAPTPTRRSEAEGAQPRCKTGQPGEVAQITPNQPGCPGRCRRAIGSR